jgi:hypothetical protein
MMVLNSHISERMGCLLNSMLLVCHICWAQQLVMIVLLNKIMNTFKQTDQVVHRVACTILG